MRPVATRGWQRAHRRRSTRLLLKKLGPLLAHRKLRTVLFLVALLQRCSKSRSNCSVAGLLHHVKVSEGSSATVGASFTVCVAVCFQPRRKEQGDGHREDLSFHSGQDTLLKILGLCLGRH